METKTIQLKFRAVNRDIFEAIRDGRKKMETRAATEKYRAIGQGSPVMFVCDDDSFVKTVAHTEIFDSIPALLEKYAPSDINPACATEEDVRAMYHSFPDYAENIPRYGIMVLKLE